MIKYIIKSYPFNNNIIFIFEKLGSFQMEKKVFNRIKAVLADTGKKNIDVAKNLKVKDETVSRWVSNSAQPSIERLYEIADFLEVDVRTLLIPNLKSDKIKQG
jgi:transcriptional regulator with XRE-family HTH domain